MREALLLKGASMNSRNSLLYMLENHVIEIPKTLVCHEDQDNLKRFLLRFPHDFTSCLLLERTLACHKPGVDLTMHVPAGSSGRKMLAGTNDGLPLTWFDEPAWCHARNLAKNSGEWILLEIDAEQFPRVCPVPHLFLSPSRSGLEAAMACLTALQGDPPPLEIFTCVFNCLRAIPASHGLCLMGRMLGRGHNDVRVLIPFKKLATLKDYLEAVNWPGDPYTQSGFHLIPDDADCYLLNLEVGSSVRRRIGIEPYFWNLNRDDTNPRWRLYIDGLLEAGLCTPEEAEALRCFPGQRSNEFCASVSTKLLIDKDLQVKAYLSIDRSVH